MNYRLLKPKEIIDNADICGGFEPVPKDLVGRPCLSPWKVLRPIVSTWLPIVQGEVTFPCVFGFWAPSGDTWIGIYRDSGPITSEFTHYHPLSQEPVKQLSPGEKAWAEFAAKRPSGAAQLNKSSWIRGYDERGDNERK